MIKNPHKLHLTQLRGSVERAERATHVPGASVAVLKSDPESTQALMLPSMQSQQVTYPLRTKVSISIKQEQ